MVLAYIMVMTSVVLSGFYTSQVNFSIASNVRDDLKAYYKARSALNLGRLILAYQYELEKDQFFGPRMRKSNFQMYQIVDMLMDPFKTGAMSVRVPGESQALASYDFAQEGVQGLGDDSGDYSLKVVPEEGRININRFATGLDQVGLFDLCMLVAPEQYDELFNVANDDSGIKAERLEVVAAIVDWVDANGGRTSLDNACQVEGDSGDEGSPYNRGKRRYGPKNSKFTTLDELFLVHGVGDDFMETFRDSLTVYPVDRVNVNIASARVLYAVLCNAVKTDEFDGNRVWACADPQLGLSVFLLALALEGYQQFVNNPLLLLQLYTVEGQLQVIEGVSPRGTVVPFRNQREFRNVLTAMQRDPLTLMRFLEYSPTGYVMFGPERLLTMDPTATGSSTVEFEDGKIFSAITTQSPKIFRITGLGEYNGTQKVLTAVVDFNHPGGKFLYWREY